LGQPIQFRQAVHELAFSPDGKRLAAGSLDGTARLIDVPTVTGIGEPLAHSGGVTGVAFSPDGRLLLTVNGAPGATSAARLWDAQSGQAASPVMSHPREISARAIAFHPDGKSFATGCVDGSVRLWDVATARQAGPPWTLRHGALAIAFGPDGRSLLAVDNHGCVRTLPLPEFGTEPIDRLIGRVNVRTGLEMDEAREVTTLLPESWRQRRDDLSDGTETSGGASEPAWHEACARDAEAIGARFTARWHLARLIADRPADGPLHARLAMVLFHDDETASAEAELARALKLGPRERLLDWLAHQAENFQAAGRPRDAVRLLDVVIAARPQEWRLYALRAEALAALGHASLGEADLDRAVDRGGDVALLFGMAEPCYRAGRYARAADLYDRAIAQGTVPYELWQQCALAHLEIDDRVGFQKICATLRSRYPAAVPDAWVRYYLASACVLGDGGVGDDGKAVRWAEDLLAALPPGRKELRHAGLHIVGGLLYRSGRYRDAIDRLNEGIAAQDGAAFSEDFLYLALAYHRLNDSARARSFLAAVPPDDPITVRDRYWDCRALPLLVREAARVILDPDMPADPFAP
jgi:tetratricopeptide (TPR) repeat protein